MTVEICKYYYTVILKFFKLGCGHSLPYDIIFFEITKGRDNSEDKLSRNLYKYG